MNGLRKSLRFPRRDLFIDLLTPAPTPNPLTSIDSSLLSLHKKPPTPNPFRQWPPPVALSSAVPSSQALDPALTDLTVVEHCADTVAPHLACWRPRDTPLEEEWEKEKAQSSSEALIDPPQTSIVHEDNIPSMKLSRPKFQTDSPIRSILSRKPKTTSLFEWTRKENYMPPTELPESPLLDPYYLKTYAEKYPKKHPEQFDKLSEHEKSLILNPYAHMLATSVRIDAVQGCRLPTWFLVRTEIVRKPDNKNDYYLVPSGIRSETADRRPPYARYCLCSKSVVDGISKMKSAHKRLTPPLIRSKFLVAKWRKDMPEHLLKLLRERTMEEILKGPLGMRSMLLGKRLEQSDGNAVGCLLDFRPEEEATETAAVLGGKLVPVHNLCLLLGIEKASELRQKLKLREDTERVGVKNNPQTVLMQMWLMRLRMYLRQWYTSWNSGQ